MSLTLFVLLQTGVAMPDPLPPAQRAMFDCIQQQAAPLARGPDPAIDIGQVVAHLCASKARDLVKVMEASTKNSIGPWSQNERDKMLADVRAQMALEAANVVMGVRAK